MMTAFSSRLAMNSESPSLTVLLVRWREGDHAAGQQVATAAYQQLRRLAAHYLRSERAGHTLEPTALVHELYLKLFATEPVRWQDRAHFFAVASQQLRRLLVDHARARQADKRGGAQLRLSLSEIHGLAQPQEEDLLGLDEALQRLEYLDPRAAQVVELRFFGGLKEEEAAEVLGISLATLRRDWQSARAWLLGQLRPQRPR